jgi:hypothetical protein
VRIVEFIREGVADVLRRVAGVSLCRVISTYRMFHGSFCHVEFVSHGIHLRPELFS